MGCIPSQCDPAVFIIPHPEHHRRTSSCSQSQQMELRPYCMKSSSLSGVRSPHGPVRTCSTEGGASIYVRDSVNGLLETRLDFRERPHVVRKWVEPTKHDGMYKDRQFPPNIAIKKHKKDRIVWKRPKDFRDNPVLFSDGTTRYEIGQRSAGTCWFLSMVANLAEKEELIYKVIPPDAWNPATGVLHCTFYHFGEWQTIYTDDTLPVIEGDTLWGASSRSDRNEMWVALLEKAFARLHGSYNTIIGGQPSDAYLALTGGLAERVDFEKHRPHPEQLFQRIRNALQTDSFLACSLPELFNNYKGLLGEHAYSLTGAGVVHTKDGDEVCLIRLRNPWGYHEWTGAWSDRSEKWRSVVGKTVDSANKDDGEFWICLDDFVTYFSDVTICSITPDVDNDGIPDPLNYITYMYGEWYAKKAGGFTNRLMNPRFVITLKKEGMFIDDSIPLVVQIIQQTNHRKEDLFEIRCDLCKVIGKCDGFWATELLENDTNVYSRVVQKTFRYLVDPGQYIIIPSTSREKQEKQFLIRVFSACPLYDIRGLGIDTVLSACSHEKYLEHGGRRYQLSVNTCVFGEWKAGVNAGGQVCYRDTFHTNPQYSLTVRNYDVPVVFQLMQNPVKIHAVGILLFPLFIEPPVPWDYLCHHYGNCLRNVRGSVVRFVTSCDVHAQYVAPPGDYVAVVFTDKPGTETTYSLLIGSNVDLGIREFQTGSLKT